MRLVRALGAAAIMAALLGGVLSAQAPSTRPGVAELALVPAALEIAPGGSARTAITVRLRSTAPPTLMGRIDAPTTATDLGWNRYSRLRTLMALPAAAPL